eukprot:6213780-Pleurochrysis_carterae.AAC.1
MAWDNASSHGAVDVTSNTKSWIHEWVVSTLGINDAVFMPPLDPKFNPVELLFNYTKAFVQQDIRSRRVGSISKDELLKLLKNGFNAVKQEHLVNWLHMGCYRVPDNVARRSGLFPHMQIVGDGVAMNRNTGELSSVSKRCQVMYDKVMSRYYRFRCLDEDEWMPYSPGYDADEADLLFCLNLRKSRDARESCFLSWTTPSRMQVEILKGANASMSTSITINESNGLAICGGTCRINFLTDLMTESLASIQKTDIHLRCYATHHARFTQYSSEKNKAIETSSQKIQTLAGMMQSSESETAIPYEDRSAALQAAARELAKRGCSTLPEFRMHNTALSLTGSNNILSSGLLSQLQLMHPMTADQAAAAQAWDNFDLFQQLKKEFEKTPPKEEGGLALFQRSRIATTLVRAWACQLTFIIFAEHNHEYDVSLQSQYDVGRTTGNWLRLAREFGFCKAATDNSGPLHHLADACLRSLISVIESHFHGFKEQLRNVLMSPADGAKGLYSHRMASDAVLFALELADTVEKALDHSEHRITELLQKFSRNTDRALVMRTVHRFMRFQYSTISQNPFELCALGNSRTAGTFTCVASSGKAVLRREMGEDTVIDTTKIGEVLAALNVSQHIIIPANIRLKEQQRRLKKTSAWGHKYTGVTRLDGIPRQLYPDSTSRSKVELQVAHAIPVDIKNVWTRDELALVLAHVPIADVYLGLHGSLTYQINQEVELQGKGLYKVERADLFEAMLVATQATNEAPHALPIAQPNGLLEQFKFIGELADGSVIAFGENDATHHRVRGLVHLAKERARKRNVPSSTAKSTSKVIWSYGDCRISYDQDAHSVMRNMSDVCIVLDAKSQRIDLNKVPSKGMELYVAIRRHDDALFKVRIEQTAPHASSGKTSRFDMIMTRFDERNAPIFVTKKDDQLISLIQMVPGFRYFISLFTFTYPKHIQPLVYTQDGFIGFDSQSPKDAEEVKSAYNITLTGEIAPLASFPNDAPVSFNTADQN